MKYILSIEVQDWEKYEATYLFSSLDYHCMISTKYFKWIIEMLMVKIQTMLVKAGCNYFSMFAKKTQTYYWNVIFST